MKSLFVTPMVRWAAAICVVAIAAKAEAVTKTFTAGVLNNNPNRPFFTAGGPLGFVGSVAPKTSNESMVTGTAIEIGGDASLPDLSDGNGLPMGVRFTFDFSFTLQSTSANSQLSDGGNPGLGVFTTSPAEGSAASNRMDAGLSEQVRFFNIVMGNAGLIDPLGLIEPGSVSIANGLWRSLRSENIDASVVVTTSSDQAGTTNVTLFGGGNPQFIANNFTTGAFPPMGEVYVKTGGTGNWKLKGIGYQADLTFTLAASQPALRRTFKFADPTFSYDNQPTHSITDRDTFVSIAAIAPPPSGAQPTVLDTNSTGVGVLSQSDVDLALAESAARRIDGTRNEAIEIEFQRDVHLESITLGNFSAPTPSIPVGETMVLSWVQGTGTNPFAALTGYSGNYALPDGMSIHYTMNEPKAEGDPFLIPFGIDPGQSDILVTAGTKLQLTSINVQENGILLDMITANLLEIPPGVPGDYNNNGSVDAADYVLWRAGGPLQNEVATVGSVTPEDYTEWQARFGNSGGGSGLASAVPEPGSWAILFSVLIIGASRARFGR